MKIELRLIGKTTAWYLVEGIENYSKRLGFYVPFEIVTLPDIKSGKYTESQQKELEGAQILNGIQPGDVLILLDERGKEMTSRGFAGYIDKKIVAGPKRIIFSVGGPYGFSDAVYARANDKISLSQMTFSHEMVRLFFVEQLYRAMTILKGDPYHHD